MGNWRASLPSNYLKASDFEKPALLTIKGFGEEKIGDEVRPCVFFEGEAKGLILNITNGTTIEEIVGSPDPDKWKGARVVLYKTQTDFKGSRVDCIRVRAPKKGAKLPEPEPEEFTAEDDSVPF